MRRRILIIVNPAAGRARSSNRRLLRVVTALERRGCRVVLRRAAAQPDNVESLAREAEPEFDAIIAGGGDGTFNAVANGLAGTAREVGLLPLGTANVLAREIGLPRDPERLAELITAAPARPIWPGRVADRLFVMMASVGFDAETVASIDPAVKRQAGRLAFVWPVFVRLWHYRSHELLVRADGVEHRAAGLIAANGRFYAGPFVVAPLADLAEPVLELVLFQRGGRLSVLRGLAALPFGLLPGLRHVTILRARSVAVSGREPLPVQADGEIVARLPVSIGIAEHPLFLIRPAT